MDSDRHIKKVETRLSGSSISSGVAFGRIHLIDPILPASVERRIIGALDVQSEVAKLENALETVRNAITRHVRDCHANSGRDFDEIITVHLAILDDHEFFSAVIDRIQLDHLTAERALHEAFKRMLEGLSASEDPYLSARAEDLRDICQSIRLVLIHGPQALTASPEDMQGRVIFSFNLHPTDVLRARRDNVEAFVSTCRTTTSHGAILLRASAIPSIGGIEMPDYPLDEDTPVLVDGDNGEIILWPEPETVERALDRSRASDTLSSGTILPPVDAKTSDGSEIALFANIDNPSQIPLCFQHRLRGIGLFRTEFLALEHGRIPDETVQFQIYLDAVKSLDGRPLIIRTFDIGADKVTAGLDECTGTNPALGVRGIRRHLVRYPEEFHTQIRAILRASVDADVSVMFPMVTHSGDVERVKALVAQVVSELDSEGVPFNRNVKLGVMVEIPSAALDIENILRLVDFVSIGTNDLLQYLTASDRDNMAVIEYQQPESSGLYQLLGQILDRARSTGRDRDVHVCGDLASDPDAAVALVRLGFVSLSINPAATPRVRRAIENVN